MSTAGFLHINSCVTTSKRMPTETKFFYTETGLKTRKFGSPEVENYIVKTYVLRRLLGNLEIRKVKAARENVRDFS